MEVFVNNAHTYDGSFYKIYAVFNSAGTYTLTLAARSSHHYIDKMTLTRSEVPTATKETFSQLPGLTIYPNPGKNELLLKVIRANTVYRIYNLHGKEISAGEISDGETINVENLHNGYYILSTIQDKYIQKVPFVKQ